jgi:Zn-dependent metalloprotease
VNQHKRCLGLGVVLTVVMAGGHIATARGATPQPSPRASSSAHPAPPGTGVVPRRTAPSLSPRKAQRVAAEQSGALAAGQSLDLAAGEKLVVKDVIADPDGSTHVRYDRTFDGLRVIGGDLVTHRDASGRIKGVSWNRLHRVAVASTRPAISPGSARAAGDRKASQVQRTTASTKAELVVYAAPAGRSTPKLAYDVLAAGVRADQTPSRLHTIVDASTGAALASFDEVETGEGHGVHVGDVTIGTTGTAPTFSMQDTVGNFTTNLGGAEDPSVGPTLPGTIFTHTSDIWGDGTVTDPASAAVDAQYGAGKTFDYFNEIQHRNGIWDTGVGARSRVHFGSGYANAFWDGTQMTYGDGEGDLRPLTEIDVAGHEMTHGVTENTAGLGGDGEAGGLNEATSDIFGTAVEWYADNPADNPDYLIGELIDLNGDGTPLRYMDSPSRDHVSPNCWSPTLGTLDVHLAAGPLNHWFYLASEGSGANVVNGVSYNSPTCNSSTVTAIGRDTAAAIWYHALTAYLTSGSDYASARDGAIQSAKDLFPGSPAVCTGVAAAFSAIAVPAGAQACATTTPPAMGSNLLRNGGFESGDTLWSGTPGVIGQWGTVQPSQPTRSGTWDAWMGGYGSSHTDSVSQWVAIPASTHAALTYYTHIATNEPASAAAHDILSVRAGTTVLQTLSNRSAATGYVLRTVNLTPYVGQTIQLRWSGTENATAATSFILDDLAVTASVAPGAPTGAFGTAASGQVKVSWVAPASNGGSAVTYLVQVVNATTSAPVGAPRPAAATSLAVTGLTNGTAYRFQVQATSPAGSSSYSPLSSAVTPKVTAAVTRLSDFNRDGITDVVARDSAGVLRLYPGDGSGGVLARRQLGTGWSTMRAIVTPGDLTGDGNADILAKDIAGVLWLYPGNGASGLGVRRRIGTGWQSYTLTAAGNLNGTGRPDLLARDTAGALWLYPFAGNAVIGARFRVGSGWNTYTIWGPGDLSGDGRADVLARNAAGELWLYRGNGAGGLAARSLVSGGWSAFTGVIAPGNSNRAVGNDLLARDTSGRLWFYPGDSAGHFTVPHVVGTGWQGFTYLG